MTKRSIHSSYRPTADISVIVPVYNRESLLPMMLRSLENQTVRPREVIFIDNNSTDATPRLLHDWKQIQEKRGWNIIMMSVEEKGAALARKKGEETATSTYLSFFDSDDVMHPEFLEKAMKDFADDPGLDITAWSVTFINPDGTKNSRRILKGRLMENHLVQGLLSTQAYAVRRDFLVKAGGWNPAIGGWDDWELGLRLLLANPKIKVANESRADLTVQEDSISGLNYLHRKGDWENTLNVMQDYLLQSESSLSPRQSAFIYRLLVYRKAILAAHYYHEGDKQAARELMNDVSATPGLGRLSHAIIKAAYLFTRIGFPAAGAIFPPLLRHLYR